MNLSEWSREVGLEEDEFLEMLELFIATSTADIALLQSAANSGVAEQVADAAHSIKGSAGNLNIQQVYDVAKMVEDKARRNILDSVQGDIRTLRENIFLLTEAVKVRHYNGDK